MNDDGAFKVNGPAESRWSWIKMNGLLIESGESRKQWTSRVSKRFFDGKIDGLFG